jgi:hypothetical protein
MVASDTKTCIIFYICFQCCIALLYLTTALSSVGFYFTVKDFCYDCRDIFNAGNTTCVFEIVDELPIALNITDCNSLPETTDIIIISVIKTLISLVTFRVIYCIQTSRKEKKHLVAHIIQDYVPDIPVDMVEV